MLASTGSLQPVATDSPTGPAESPARMAEAQLEAYNQGDLDAFCACYHPEVRVLAADGSVELDGIAAFRGRYAPLFSRGGYGATVFGRLFVGGHCVDLEHWWREDPETGARIEGTVLVRYSLRDGRIGVVQFLR